MVFASHIFLLFLLVVLLSTKLVSLHMPNGGKWVLIAASLFFYGYWLPVYLVLLMGSMLFNFALGNAISRRAGASGGTYLTIFGVAANLTLIGYYKYAAFLLETWNIVATHQVEIPQIILPIGISFFTFQQIAYLIDINRKNITPPSATDYVFFVSFFPQLIAGPIVTPADMLPQLAAKKNWQLQSWQVALGFALFSVGLFKKTVIIDPYVPYIDRIFHRAADGVAIGLIDGWTAALGYGFQIYFDFSAYSDMAIGLAFMFGLRLPVNFFSPYKAASIREFWRRWHITLSRFLRDYIYIPLGGSRHGTARMIGALMATMGLGGLWHGAGWTFIIWGLAHGAMLAANHLINLSGFSAWISALSPKILGVRLSHLLGVLLTFVLVTITWVYFRAPDVSTAHTIIAAMFGQGAPTSITRTDRGIFLMFPVYFAIVWFLPNAMQIFGRYQMALHSQDYAKLSESKGLNWLFGYQLGAPRWAVVSALTFCLAWFFMSNLSPFIYFQF